jgi:hypothetical protein
LTAFGDIRRAQKRLKRRCHARWFEFPRRHDRSDAKPLEPVTVVKLIVRQRHHQLRQRTR